MVGCKALQMQIEERRSYSARAQRRGLWGHEMKCRWEVSGVSSIATLGGALDCKLC